MHPYIAHAFNTVFSMYQMKYNKEWDEKLNNLMDEEWESFYLYLYTGDDKKPEPEVYTIYINDVRIWVANKWYSYGNRYAGFGEVACWENSRPSIKTMMKLDRLVNHLKKEHKSKVLKETNYD